MTPQDGKAVADTATEIYQGLATWLVPPVLGFAIHYLQQISQKLGQISESLAVVVTKIDAHEKRITALEDRPDRTPGGYPFIRH